MAEKSLALSAKRKKYWNNLLTGYMFLSPNIVGFLAFTLIPVVASLCLAFVKWDILRPAEFVGLDNFRKLAVDRDFWYYMYNTVYFMVGIPLGMGFSLALALLINRKMRGVYIFRTLYFLPAVCSAIAIALVWRWIYNPQFGLLNTFLRFVGVSDPPLWLCSTAWAKPAILITGLWMGAGYNMLLYLAALQGIPEDLYEAASIDGASLWQKFRHITWPMLSFVNFFIVIMGVIGGFQAFGIQYVMTGGGPAGSTTTIVYYIYNNAFQWFKMGYASAISWVLFIIMFAFTMIYWKYGGGKGYHYN